MTNSTLRDAIQAIWSRYSSGQITATERDAQIYRLSRAAWTMQPR